MMTVAVTTAHFRRAVIMSTILRFPKRGHGRTSSVAAIRAKASRVIPGTPRSSASRDSGSQRADGMPRLRQQLTAGELTERAEATSLVPPSASMTESGVIMPATVVCTTQTCQAFATCETTFDAGCGPIRGMIDPPTIIGNRLEALRKELGFKTQEAFAEKMGIDKSTYSSIKNGKRNLSFETACVIREIWGISIDWLFFGDLQQSAIQIMSRIGRAERSSVAPVQKRKTG